MPKTLSQVVITVAGLPRAGFAVTDESDFITYYDARGELLVGAESLDVMVMMELGYCATAREFEALTGVAPSVWETTCGWCGRLTLVAAGETDDLCPRCHWSLRS